jgi:hypothetical protein
MAVFKDAKKRQKKVRLEMNKLLNIVDALDGLIADEHLKLLELVAKLYLQPIIGSPKGDGHGHGESARDHDHAPEGAEIGAHPGMKKDAPAVVPDQSTPEAHDSVSPSSNGAFAPAPPARNAWFSMTRDQQKKYTAERRQAAQAAKRAVEVKHDDT